MFKEHKGAQRMLDPPDTPLSLVPNYVRDRQTTLDLQEKVKVLTTEEDPRSEKETFDVMDESGATLFRATGKPMKLKNMKRITDTSGATLFQITASMQGSLQRAFVGADRTGTLLFRAEKKWSWGAKLEVTFEHARTREPVTLIVKGHGLMTTAEVTLDGQVIAVFTREFSGKALLSNSKPYHLTVAAGVDLALMTALCVIFDDCKFDDPTCIILSDQFTRKPS